MRMVKKLGGWKQKLWKGDKLELLLFGIPRDMTRIEFKNCCDREGLHCLARGQVGREHEHFRVKLTKGDSQECLGVDIEKLSNYVRKFGWRVCIANMIETEKVRRQEARATEAKKGPSRAVEQASQKKSEKKRKANDGVRKISNREKRKLRVGSWNVCGFARSERKRLEIVDQVEQSDLDVVGIQETWELKDGDVVSKLGKYRWVGKARKGLDPKKRGEGGVGFLVKEHLFDVVEVVVKTEFEESLWLKIPGERGEKDLFLGNVYVPPSSKKVASKAQENFGQIGEDVQRFSRKGEVVMVGDFNSRVGKASSRGQAIGQHGEDKVNDNGVRMLEFLGSNELMVLNGRRECDKPEFTRQRAVCNEYSILDYILVDRGSTQIPELHISAIDIGSTDHFLIWANIDRSRKIKSKKQRKVFRWKVERLGDDGTRDEFQKGLAGSVESFRKLLRSVEDGQVDVQTAGDRVIEGWESIVNATAERVVGRKVVRCGVSVKWWDDELKEEIGERREVFKQYLRKASEESWETYRAKRKQVKGLVKKKKKCIWDEVVQKANGGLEGNIKQMWEGTSGMVTRTAQGVIQGSQLCEVWTVDQSAVGREKGKFPQEEGGRRPHVFTVGRIIQGRKRAGKPTYCFFLDVKKAYDTVWRNGLWKQLSKYGIKGKMWRVLKKMTECTKSAVMLDGELSKFFDIEQGVPQGCTLSPTLFQLAAEDKERVKNELAAAGLPKLPTKNRLDPSVGNISKEGLLLVTKATEVFMAVMTDHAWKIGRQ
ncbi:unnamed protein product [Ectocarpus sp. CCAP 1310/34]|nr:unnamed protein product [Ectocarpus sp. CCAP 1310/34]